METANRRLMWHGMLLFLLGLFTGFAEPHFTNVRMGLAAHLEGVMNGILLLALGAIWPHVRLGRNAQAAAFWTALYSAYANWLLTTLAAIFGTGALSPMTAPGFRAQAWQESLVTAGLMSVGIVVVASTLIFLWGLRGKAPLP
ncbi:MAG: hydrogenase [Acidobacteriaceae bacterium]|jgi:(hydroxyamino)benzene mutase